MDTQRYEYRYIYMYTYTNIYMERERKRERCKEICKYSYEKEEKERITTESGQRTMKIKKENGTR